MQNKMLVAAVAVSVLICAQAYAEVQSVEDIPTPTPQFQDHGGVTPWFWIGLQTVFSAGYNIETGAGGFRDYGGDDHTYAAFNLAFVDSHYSASKFYEVPTELDPDAWTGHFVLMNFTSRLNSYELSHSGVGLNEVNAPAWLAEITGKGARIGFFTQAANMVAGLYDSNRDKATSYKPLMSITGGNKVLNLRANQLGTLYYEKANDKVVTTTYNTVTSSTIGNGAIWYIGYDKKELFNTYLTMLSEGHVNSDVSNGYNKGFAMVFDFGASPLGLFTDDENPVTFNVEGNFIAGFNWKNPSSAVIKNKENIGFGIKGEGGFWLGRDNLVLSPVFAFDGKLNTDMDFFWKIGGGLTFRFSGMRWTSDDWGDLYAFDGSNTNQFASWRYENKNILKYAYAQVYGATVPDPDNNGNTDFNLLFRVEEPDGNVGFHERLGFMGEFRLYNMLGKELSGNKPKEMKWEAQGRVSWDFNIKHYLLTPYLRGYLNDDAVLKLRIGASANLIPFTGFEIAYTSANLNKGVSESVSISSLKSNKSYTSNFDAGRIELLIILKSDDMRPTVPKRMSDWNYPASIKEN